MKKLTKYNIVIAILMSFLMLSGCGSSCTATSQELKSVRSIQNGYMRADVYKKMGNSESLECCEQKAIIEAIFDDDLPPNLIQQSLMPLCEKRVLCPEARSKLMGKLNWNKEISDQIKYEIIMKVNAKSD
ncbi:MAG: hypothetical protein K9M75_02405 [Phycisphaerae bacterium]|nr:hypothetical protein [Phycisphaerae bacterium]